MRVTIPDSLAAKLEPFVTPTRSIDDLVTLAVSRVGEVPPTGRFFLVNEEMIDLLERRLGSPALGSAVDLFRAIDKLAGVELHRINMEFSPAQLQEIKERAAREGATPDDYSRRIVHQMIPMFFQTGPAQSAPVAAPRKK